MSMNFSLELQKEFIVIGRYANVEFIGMDFSVKFRVYFVSSSVFWEKRFSSFFGSS